METTEHQIKAALRHIRRIGDTIQFMFFLKKCNFEKFVTSEEALNIYNSYGMSVREVIFMIDSHRLAIDDLADFEMLVDEQEKNIKGAKPS